MNQPPFLKDAKEHGEAVVRLLAETRPQWSLADLLKVDPDALRQALEKAEEERSKKEGGEG